MVEQSILISYDGGDAVRNSIDAKLYGQSLQGIDRLVSDCLIIFSEERLPKRGERAPVILKVKEPERGSYNSPAFYQEISDTLALGIPLISSIGPDIVSHYVSVVLDKFRGKDSAVEVAIQKMAQMHQQTVQGLTDMHRESIAALDRKDVRQHEERMDIHDEHMGIQDLLRRAIGGSGSAAVDYVAPVGRSVDTASFISGSLPPVVVNKTDAEAIRDSQKLDWLPPANLALRTDGFKFHSNGLSVENPEHDGFMMAEVADPEFDNEDNDYTKAAGKRATIEVLGRKGYKNGVLAKLQILAFLREIADQG
ncbi:hypothetical protein [Sphingomonas sp. PvP056]|jgi:hypothetical protein|uniref:DUF7946 domain-containing protein n=1 Tax=Sphingomonas sp. PvP056 TaxID=3156392 RepID=UPI003399B2CE